jgi:hypothetical protein
MGVKIFKKLRLFRFSSKIKPKTGKYPPKLARAECVVCLETEQCLSTRLCYHAICVNCLGSYINVTHNSRMPCPCPSHITCKQSFTIEDLTPFLDVEQIQKIWLVQAGIQIEKGHGMYCPNSKCSKPILWNAVTNRKAITGKCRACGTIVCVPCKSAYHSGLTYV